MSAAIIEIKPRTVTAGKFLKRPASSLCSRRNVRPSITHRNARVVSLRRDSHSGADRQCRARDPVQRHESKTLSPAQIGATTKTQNARDRDRLAPLVMAEPDHLIKD